MALLVRREGHGTPRRATSRTWTASATPRWFPTLASCGRDHPIGWALPTALAESDGTTPPVCWAPWSPWVPGCMADVVATEPDQSGQDGRAPHRQDRQRL